MFMSGLFQTIHGLHPVGVLRTTRFAPGESVAALYLNYVILMSGFATLYLTYDYQ